MAAAPVDAGVVSARFRFEVPDPLDEAEVPGLMKTAGLPLRMRAVRSKRKLPELERHFTDAFEKAGLFLPPPEAITAPGPHVTGYDTKKRISYTALFQPNQDGTVTVVLSEVFLHAKEERAPFAPVFPGSGAPIDSEAEGARLLHYTTSAHPKEIEAFYREVFAKAGCRETEPLTFECGDKRNRVWVRERAKQPTSVVLQQTPR